MKTELKTSAIALALIFSAFVFAAYAGGPKNLSKVTHGSLKYTVKINAVKDVEPGSTLIELVDQFSHPVAPPQVVVPGIEYYTFNVSNDGSYSVRVIYNGTDGRHTPNVRGVGAPSVEPASVDPRPAIPPQISRLNRLWTSGSRPSGSTWMPKTK